MIGRGFHLHSSPYMSAGPFPDPDGGQGFSVTHRKGLLPIDRTDGGTPTGNRRGAAVAPVRAGLLAIPAQDGLSGCHFSGAHRQVAVFLR